MKTVPEILVFLFLVLLSGTCYAQNIKNTDSLKLLLRGQKEDTNKVNLLYTLSFSYTTGSYADSALIYAQQALELAEKLKFEPGMFWSEITLSEPLAILGNYPLSIAHSFKALALAKRLNDPLKLCYANGGLAACYYYMGDYGSSLQHAREVVRIMHASKMNDMYWMWIQMSRAFHNMNEPDSALLYAKMANERVLANPSPYVRSVMSTVMGNAYAGKESYDSALLHYRVGIAISAKARTPQLLIDNYYGIAEVFKAINDLDSAHWYLKQILSEKITQTYPAGLLKAATLLADIYESQNNTDSTLKYLKTAMVIKDSLSNRQKTIAVQNLIYKEQEKLREIENVKRQFRAQVRMYALAGTLAAVAIAAGIMLRNRRRKQLENIRNHIADDLHDDIGSTLSSIGIMSELAKLKSPEASTLLTSIGESSQSVQESMSDIVWSIKSENDRFENVVQRMAQFATEILEAKNIGLDFNVDEGLATLKLTMKQRKNLYLIFKEAINNAAKHSNTRSISVHIRQRGQQVELLISDDGKGFDLNREYTGNGMSTLKKRAEEIDGMLDMRSRKGEGTVVNLRFKIS